MDAEIKRKWVQALRSGKYEQTKGLLKSPDGAFCCIGVLGAIQSMDFKIKDLRSSTIMSKYSAGLSTISQLKLANMNDEGRSFAEIADYIEANL